MRDECIDSGGALCAGEINQHRGVIDVIRGAEVAHAVGSKHEWEIGVERTRGVVDGE